MDVTYTTPDGRAAIRFTASGTDKVFAFLALLHDAFGETECGCCKSKRLRPDVREADGNRFYKVYCLDCGAQLDMGQRKADDSLYPRRIDPETKKAMPNAGWYIYAGVRSTKK